MKQAVIIFDGVCNLCNQSVQFIIRHDPERKFRFAPFQTAYGEQFLELNEPSAHAPESLILVDGDKIFHKSDAALQIAKKLNGFWPVFYAFIIIPRPIRDFVYDFIARHRYRLFGKRNACMVPDDEAKQRFIDES